MVIQYNKIASFNLITDLSVSDIFLKSELVNSKYYSYNLSANAIYNSYKHEIENSNFNFYGKWNVTGYLRNKLENIPVLNTANALSSTVTKEWCDKHLRSLLAALSAQLFDNDAERKIPSYVGEVIVTQSSNFSTESQIKKVYGGKKWVKIEGRFLLGAGENEANTNNSIYGKCSAGEISISRSKKMGGAKEVTLKNTSIPGHTHAFTGDGASWNKLPTGEISMEVGAEGDCGEFGEMSNTHRRTRGKRGGGIGSHHHYSGTFGSEAVTLRSIIGKVKGTVTKSFTFTPKVTIQSACGNSNGSVSPHNNIPPYVAAYIWERVE